MVLVLEAVLLVVQVVLVFVPHVLGARGQSVLLVACLSCRLELMDASLALGMSYGKSVLCVVRALMPLTVADDAWHGSVGGLYRSGIVMVLRGVRLMAGNLPISIVACVEGDSVLSWRAGTVAAARVVGKTLGTAVFGGG